MKKLICLAVILILTSLFSIPASAFIIGRMDSLTISAHANFMSFGDDDFQLKLNKAISIYKEIQEKTPDRIDILFCLGVGHILNNEQQEAFKVFSKLIEIEPEYFGSWAGLGYLQWQAKNYEEALISINKALKIDPCDVFSLFIYNWILEALERKEEADQIFIQAISCDSPSPLLIEQYATILVFDKQYQKALQEYERAISAYQKKFSLYDLEKAKQFDPFYRMILWGRINALIGLGRLKESADLVRKMGGMGALTDDDFLNEQAENYQTRLLGLVFTAFYEKACFLAITSM